MSVSMLELRDVDVTFHVSRGILSPRLPLRALRGVSLKIKKGETVAIVGESGSGKTTLAMCILNLLAPTHGQILLDGRPMTDVSRKSFAKRVQPVFQDPYSSLNPRRPIGDCIAQPMRIHGFGDRLSRRRRALEMMDRVGLPERFATLLPHQLSGGQRQRVAIARALVVEPEILVLDEPTSALDVSVQAQILNLLDGLRRDLDLTYVLITHNLAVVRHMADQVSVMYLGRIIEEAPTDDLFEMARHPYTTALLASVLTPEPGLGLPDLGLSTSFPNALHPPTGCHFHPRCRHAFGPCQSIPPELIGDGAHRTACHLTTASSPAGQARTST